MLLDVNGYVTYKTNFDKYNKQCTKISNMILSNISKLGIKNNGTKTRVCKDMEYKWLYSDGSHADYYGIIRYCMKGTAGDGPGIELDINSGKGIPAVLVEHCYIKNGNEQYINSNEKIKKIAKCDADAIVSYYNLELKSNKKNNLDPFVDVSLDDWYASAVKYCYENGIIKGTTNTTFSPNTNLTRGMLVTILWRMEGSPKASTSQFIDVKSSQYYYNAVNWAASKKVVNGYGNGKFGPNDNITREQLAVMLRNYALYKKKDVSARADLTKFTDNKKISTNLKDGVSWAVAKNIISGKSNGTKIDPKGKATISILL